MGEAIVFIINSNFAFRDGNPSATADGTDCFQVRFWTFEASRLAVSFVPFVPFCGSTLAAPPCAIQGAANLSPTFRHSIALLVLNSNGSPQYQ
jgi:hypothetical protein